MKHYTVPKVQSVCGSLKNNIQEFSEAKMMGGT